MGKHAGYFGIKQAKNGGYRVRLCISIGAPQEISFSANLVKKGKTDREGRTVYPGLGFKTTTRRGVDAYIIPTETGGASSVSLTAK